MSFFVAIVAHVMGLAVLRFVSLLVPGSERSAWFREWSSELWHVRRTCTERSGICWAAEREAASFCAGAIPDALCMRQNAGVRILPTGFRFTPPMRSIALLFAIAAASYGVALLTSGVRFQTYGSPYKETQRLVLIRDACCYDGTLPTIHAEQFRIWKERRQAGFEKLSFYRIVSQSLSGSDTEETRVSVAHASTDLFETLGVSLRFRASEHDAPPGTPKLVLSDEVWRTQFGSDSQIGGHVLRVGSQKAVVLGVAPAGSWRLPGDAGAWLLEPDDAMSAKDVGFVVARAKPKTPQGRWPAVFLQIKGQPQEFVCLPLEERLRQPWNIFLFTVFVACLALPATTSLSLGEYPLTSRELSWSTRLLRWGFLSAKVTLLLPVVLFASLDIAHVGSGWSPMSSAYIQIVASFSLCLFGLRWAIKDQRQRCPVCLNRLKHPARVGEPSRNFLGWNGTELICAGGHGLLHVPEIPTSWFSTQRWQYLDASWQVLFTAQA